MGNEHFNVKYKNLVVYLLQVSNLFACFRTFPPKLEIEPNVKVFLLKQWALHVVQNRRT